MTANRVIKTKTALMVMITWILNVPAFAILAKSIMMWVNIRMIIIRTQIIRKNKEIKQYIYWQSHW